ncbi:MAG TPA: tRNA guanosine(34) transglycosylase Tgt [Candidatus Pelagibacter sp.]|jgi:queuine tRNA-ribosyltransferase|nr:tRNA guanosine(34) transglycosylase Tgt [Candidatus Pelagibacter sp.]
MFDENFSFKVLREDGVARLGKIFTHRGLIDTPTFMTVGTQGTVKAAFMDDVILSGAQIILSNTYHLMIRPGVERIKRVGGLHQFMNCKLPILTDSGGFQIMSLSKLVKIDEKIGATFNSHIDGKKFILSPEESIKIQKNLNSDIVMVLDECPKLTNDKKSISKSLNLSINWAKRSKDAFGNDKKKALFGIVQGGIYKDLRLESLEGLKDINFDGYALGGLAVGESQKQMFKILDEISIYLPKNKPRYLMGVGTPSDILGAVKCGIDMFDCVMPTRAGRTGLAFTWEGRLNLKNAKYKNDDSPINKNMKIRNLNLYSKSYINHLINSNEILASMIITMNNIYFYQELMNNIRESIKNNNFDKFYNKYIDII